MKRSPKINDPQVKEEASEFMPIFSINVVICDKPDVVDVDYRIFFQSQARLATMDDSIFVVETSKVGFDIPKVA